MNDRAYWRQLDILNPNETRDKEVAIIGAGGIGSPLALLLAKIGFTKLTVFDFDTIEEHNIPNQLFRLDDIGKHKTEALKEIIKDFTGAEVETVNNEWKGELKPIMIVATDNMTSRQAVYNKVKDSQEVELLIDARMGAELIRIYAIEPLNPMACEFYEKMLYPSEEAEKLPCTAQAIFYNTFTLSGLVACILKHFIMLESYPKEIILDLSTFTFFKN